MTERAVVIAHRGASGYLPEHTLASKAMAHGLGADYLEQDVVATRDAELVVLHDLHLDDVTDVAARFPGRCREDGKHYVVDFDLAELRTLTVFERRAPGRHTAKYVSRFPGEVGLFRIVTLTEELELIRGLNRSTRRSVGVYPEIKDPRWHARHGIDLAKLLLEKLTEFDYAETADPVFVQCFDADELQRVKNELGCRLRLIQLVGSEPEFAELLTSSGLQRVASYAAGLGPSHKQLAEAVNGVPRATPIAALAKQHGLLLHPYTFRRDELPNYATSLEQLLEFFFTEVRVDGVFCDHTDVAVRVRDRAQQGRGRGR